MPKYVATHEIEAIEFLGWQNAEEVWEFCKGRAFYVPEEAEHRMRLENEKDRSTGYGRGRAPSFLVLAVAKDFSIAIRVDQRDYIIRNGDGALAKIPGDRFRSDYKLVD